MNLKTNLSSPIYLIPLTDEELIIVGRITVIWGQVDHQIQSLLWALIPPDQCEKLADKMIGFKFKRLREFTEQDSDVARRKMLDEACKAIGAVIEDRNVMTHGQWGWEYRPSEKLYYRMACSHKRPEENLYPDKLKEIHNLVCIASAKIDYADYILCHGTPPPPALNRLRVWSPIDPWEMPGPPSVEEYFR